jgi:hypothetical protein
MQSTTFVIGAIKPENRRYWLGFVREVRQDGTTQIHYMNAMVKKTRRGAIGVAQRWFRDCNPHFTFTVEA